MDKFNVLNKVITIENANGDTIFSIEIDKKGDIVNMKDCSVADIDFDNIFYSEKDMLRLQVD